MHSLLSGVIPAQPLVVSSEASKQTIEANLKGFQFRRGCLLVLSYDTMRIYRDIVSMSLVLPSLAVHASNKCLTST